jgi:hypothetical protein
MNMKLICGAVALATVMSFAAQAADAPAAAGAAMAPAAATEKCEVTKDGKTTTTEVAVGSCVKEGGKVVTAPAADAPAAAPAAAPAEKK